MSNTAAPAERTGGKNAAALAEVPRIKLLHTIQETCDAIGSKKSTIYNFVRAGKLDMVKVGSSSRITDESLRTLVASFPSVSARAA